MAPHLLSMNALGLLPPVAGAPQIDLPKEVGKGVRVVILGGGIAGLASAYELGKTGSNVPCSRPAIVQAGATRKVRKLKILPFSAHFQDRRTSVQPNVVQLALRLFR
jgi:glycine/D-amino acid oxidase-like deaminating enzyme